MTTRRSIVASLLALCGIAGAQRKSPCDKRFAPTSTGNPVIWIDGVSYARCISFPDGTQELASSCLHLFPSGEDAFQVTPLMAFYQSPEYPFKARFEHLILLDRLPQHLEACSICGVTRLPKELRRYIGKKVIE